MRLYKVFTREIGIYPVKLVWNCLYGSKEARYKDPPDISNMHELVGPWCKIFKQPADVHGE